RHTPDSRGDGARAGRARCARGGPGGGPGEPLPHLTGVAPFRHVVLQVGPGVFVPRPETELLAGWAVDEARSAVGSGTASPVVVDLGTGSGAIARSVADEVPFADVHAVELDERAH